MFEETNKALDHYEKVEEDIKASLPRREKLEFIKEHIPKASSREELEQLETKKRDLEVSLQVEGWDKPFYPPVEEYNKVKQNYKIEHEKAQSELNKKYKKLKDVSEAFETQANGLLNEIEEIERSKGEASKISLVLNGEVYQFADANNFLGGGEMLKKKSSHRARKMRDVSFMIEEMNQILSNLPRNGRPNYQFSRVVDAMNSHKAWR